MGRVLLCMVLLTVAALLTESGLGKGAPDQRIAGTIYVSCDTLEYYLGDRHGRFPLRGAADRDTTKLPAIGPLVLMSSVDTLVVVPRMNAINLWIALPERRILETLVFHLDDPKLDTLRAYARFSGRRAPGQPAFTYARPEDSKLAELRRVCKLDSVAGGGTEIGRLLRLLEWAHTVVRHDGSAANPEPREALHLIDVCRSEGRGVNCRMMATILNEALLSLGFKSRYVTCLPYDRKDMDCHVTNLVYAESLHKWIYLDPTFGGYFMDEDGLLLNHAEVRDRLIAGATLRLPAGMDWNGQPYEDWLYLRYMAKNLFRFSCPLGSASGYESTAPNPAWVALNPAGYDSLQAGTVDSTGGRITYVTSDADSFWRPPESTD